MGQYERDQAHRLLDSVAWLEARVERRLNELERRKCIVERLNVGSLEMPVMGGLPSSGAEWDVYISSNEEYERALKNYIQTKDEVLETLDDMKNLTHARILELKYLSGKFMSYHDIGGKLCYSSTRIGELMDHALEEFWAIYQKRGQNRTKSDESGQNRTRVSKTG